MPSATIDRNALNNLLAMFSGDTAFLMQVIDTYLSDAANLLNTIRRAAHGGQADELRRAAHSLKSNSANLGATRLTTLCRELEELGKNGSVAGASDRLAELETEFEKVRAELKALQEKGL